MKPRITLAETTLPDGSPLKLEEHDGRMSLVIHGQQICGPATRSAEEELARLACAPFRPARQPKLWFAGLGLGQALAAAADELKQKRANFIVAEPMDDLPRWHREFLPQGVFATDGRVTRESDCGPAALTSREGEFHAILLHLEVAPASESGKPLPDDTRWLSAAFGALQPGGLLAIAGSRPNARLTRTLRRSGFDVAEHSVPSSPNARRPRMLPIWLARKPGRVE